MGLRIPASNTSLLSRSPAHRFNQTICLLYSLLPLGPDRQGEVYKESQRPLRTRIDSFMGASEPMIECPY